MQESNGKTSKNKNTSCSELGRNSLAKSICFVAAEYEFVEESSISMVLMHFLYDFRSMVFVVDCFFGKLLETNNIDTFVRHCQQFFNSKGSGV